MMYKLLMMVVMMIDDLLCQMFSLSLPLSTSVSLPAIFGSILFYISVLSQVILFQSIKSPRVLPGHTVKCKVVNSFKVFLVLYHRTRKLSSVLSIQGLESAPLLVKLVKVIYLGILCVSLLLVHLVVAFLVFFYLQV